MSRLLLFAMLSCVLSIAYAHNAKIATYTLRDTGSGWYIEMSFAQASIDAMMDKKLGGNLDDIELDEYKHEVFEYIKENFELEVNGRNIPLGDGGIMLGSHQTDLKFVIPTLPDHPESMMVHIPAFRDAYNHTNIFRIYRGGDQLHKFFLSADNDFESSLLFKDGLIVETDRKLAGSNQQVVISGIFLLLVIGGIFLARRGYRPKNSGLVIEEALLTENQSG